MFFYQAIQDPFYQLFCINVPELYLSLDSWTNNNTLLMNIKVSAPLRCGWEWAGLVGIGGNGLGLVGMVWNGLGWVEMGWFGMGGDGGKGVRGG